MKEKTNQICIYFSIIICIIIDQITKHFISINQNGLSQKIINGFLRFTYCENRGVAFGLGDGNVIIFIICNIVILGIIAKFIIGEKERLEGKSKFVLGLVWAGGASNLIDRVFRGYVVDFIDIRDFFMFPIFNLADILICIGVIGFAINSLVYVHKKNKVYKEGKIERNTSKG